jgi:4a-hydroxytetrahydrobiopterin dehydratase
MARRRLTDDEIATRLRELPGWTRDGDALRRELRFPAFMEAIAFVNRVAETAESLDHHPDITIEYTRVTLRVSTHDSGGLTEADFTLAARIGA